VCSCVCTCVRACVRVCVEGTRVGGGGRLVVAVVVAGGSSSGGVGGGERYPVANQRVFGVRCDQQLENTKWIWRRRVELLDEQKLPHWFVPLQQHDGSLNSRTQIFVHVILIAYHRALATAFHVRDFCGYCETRETMTETLSRSLSMRR